MTCRNSVVASLLVAVMAFFLSTTSVLAGAGLLTSIGNLQTPQTYSQWWYTSENPLLRGVAAAGEQVSVTIDGTANSVTADANGIWAYQPTTLGNGDHSVSIAAGGQTYAFTLTIGSTVPADITAGETTSPDELPQAGTASLTMLLGTAGVLLLLGGSLALAKNQRVI
jgi:hypothetical protein